MSPNKSDQNKSSIIPSLKSFSRGDLENLISDLYGKSDTVRNVVDFRLTGNTEPFAKKYKKLIKNLLIEDLEEGINGLEQALNAVHEFCGFVPNPGEQADIMLYFVEAAVYCINDFGDLYEELYDESADMFEETLNFLKKHHMLEDFRDRCKKIVEDSENSGYGFYDSLGDTFSTFFHEGKTRQKKIIKKAGPKKAVKKPKLLKR